MNLKESMTIDMLIKALQKAKEKGLSGSSLVYTYDYHGCLIDDFSVYIEGGDIILEK